MAMVGFEVYELVALEYELRICVCSATMYLCEVEMILA